MLGAPPIGTCWRSDALERHRQSPSRSTGSAKRPDSIYEAQAALGSVDVARQVIEPLLLTD